MKVTEEELNDILGGDRVVTEEVIGTWRWGHISRAVFEDNDDTFWSVEWRVHATEGWDPYSFPAACVEVVPVDVTRVEYVPVQHG